MMHPQPGHHRRRPRRSRVLQVALLLAALAVGSAEHAKGSRRTPLGFLSAFQHQRGTLSGPSFDHVPDTDCLCVRHAGADAD